MDSDNHEERPIDPFIIQALTADLMETCPTKCRNHLTPERLALGEIDKLMGPSAYEDHWLQAKLLIKQGWVNRA